MTARDGYEESEVVSFPVRFDAASMSAEVVFSRRRMWADGEEAVARVSPTYFAEDRACVALQVRVLQARDGAEVKGGHIFFGGGGQTMHEIIETLALAGWTPTEEARP